MKVIKWLLAALVAVTLIGAPSAAFADEPAPGSDKEHAILIEPRQYEAVCVGYDVLVKSVAGVGHPKQYSWVAPFGAIEPGKYTATMQTGLISGVWYTFGPDTWVDPWNGSNTSQVQQSFDKPECNPIVIPAEDVIAPTQNADGSLNLPDVEGIFYGVYEYETETIVVASTWNNPGYVLEGGAQEWSFPKLVTVTPLAPTFTDPAPGIGNLIVTLPTQDGVTYSVRKFSNGKVQVTAAAAPGFVLTGTTQWQRIDR